jgi:hypothetical protein
VPGGRGPGWRIALAINIGQLLFRVPDGPGTGEPAIWDSAEVATVSSWGSCSKGTWDGSG